MEPGASYFGTLFEVAQWNALALLAALLALVIFARIIFQYCTAGGGTPLILRDPIPFVFNITQKALENAPIVKFWLGTKPVYIVADLKNYQTIFSWRELTYNGSMLQIGFPKHYRMSSNEIERFANDKSEHKATALLGTENIPLEQRYWLSKYHVLYHFLSRPHHIKPIVQEFGRQFSWVVEKYLVGGWTTLSINELTRRDFTRRAITTLFGPKILALNPDFLDAFWGYDDYVPVLVYGFPQWLYPAPFRASDRFLDRMEKYVEAGLKNFDWDVPDVEAQWEPLDGPAKSDQRFSGIGSLPPDHDMIVR